MIKWFPILLGMALTVATLGGGTLLHAEMCSKKRAKIDNWPDKQHDFPYCHYEDGPICIGPRDKMYNKPISNWNRDFPLSDMIGDHCPESYYNYAYAYLVGQLGYCGITCPDTIVDLFPKQKLANSNVKFGGARVEDLSVFPDMWVPYSRYEHAASVGNHLAVLAEDALEDGNMEGASAQDKEQALRDMYRSANFFTLADRAKFVNQACTVSNESELREAIQWAMGFDRQFSFKQFDTDTDYEVVHFGTNYTTEDLGKAMANWAFDHMCTTGARRVSSSGEDVRYLLLPKICNDSGQVKDTAKGGFSPYPVMWRQVRADQYLSSYSATSLYQGCLMAGNDAADIKAILPGDVVTYDEKGPTYKVDYVWIPDYSGCWGDDCIIEKTIQLKSDVELAQPVTISVRAPYIQHSYELTITGKAKNNNYKITTAKSFEPVDTADQNGLFNMVEQIDRLIVNDVQFDSATVALVSGPGSTAVQNSTIHSKVPITVRDGTQIINNIFKPNGTNPFLKVADGANNFAIRENTFGQVGDTLPTNAVVFDKLYDNHLSGETFDNTIDAYVLDDNLFYIKNDVIKPPAAGTAIAALYHSHASGECTGNIHVGGIGCYSVPITLTSGIYAVEVFAIKAGDGGSKSVVPLGLYCDYFDKRCGGKLEVDPKNGGVATIWLPEYVNGNDVGDLEISPSGGEIKPLQLRMIAYGQPLAHGKPLNDSPVGTPSALSSLIEVSLLEATVSADDLKKAQGKYIQWINGPVSKWANACVENETCADSDKDCKMNCGWVNACAELQKDIERLTKKENPNASYPMDYWVQWNSQLKKYASKLIADAKGEDKQAKPVTEFCKKYEGGDQKKFLWKEFGGTLDYEPEDPVAVACYWDTATSKQTGQLWVGGKCESTNKSKCIWDAVNKKMTGKIWKGTDNATGQCFDSEEASACLQQKGMQWLAGKCQSEKDVCIAKGKTYSASGQCQCPKGTTTGKDGSCVQPPPASPCKNPKDVLKDGICVPADTVGSGTGATGDGGTTPGETGGGTAPGQGATVPDKKPLTGVGGEVVQQEFEKPGGGSSDSGSKWNKFWGCSLVR